jgi:hypothetical protein
MTAVQTVSPEEDASAERWRQWQLRNVVTSRKDAKRARIAFTALSVALAVTPARFSLRASPCNDRVRSKDTDGRSFSPRHT